MTKTLASSFLGVPIVLKASAQISRCGLEISSSSNLSDTIVRASWKILYVRHHKHLYHCQDVRNNTDNYMRTDILVTAAQVICNI